MAEAVVGALIGKLGRALAKEAATYGAYLLYKEASAIKSLFREIRRAERELESRKAYLRELEKFMDVDEELRTFSVDDVTSEHLLNLRNALLKMSNLVSLSITMSNENEALPLEELFLPEALCKLGLTGQLEKKRMHHILSSWLYLKNLTQLYLMSSKLDESSFPSLVVLRSLCLITLCKAYDRNKLCFSSQSFPRLRELRIWCAPQLNQVEIEKDASWVHIKEWRVSTHIWA